MKKFRLFLKSILIIAIATFLVVGQFSWQKTPPGSTEAFAATANPSTASTGYEVIPIPVMGIYTSDRANLVTFKAPYPFYVTHVSAKARGSSGTTPTLTVDIKESGTSILSTPFSVYSSSVSEGTVSDKKLADESTITIDFNIGGTSPVWQDITILLGLKRL